MLRQRGAHNSSHTHAHASKPHRYSVNSHFYQHPEHISEVMLVWPNFVIDRSKVGRNTYRSMPLALNLKHMTQARFTYDLSPMSIVIEEKTVPLYHFLTSVCAIIGGYETPLKWTCTWNCPHLGYFQRTHKTCTCAQKYEHTIWVECKVDPCILLSRSSSLVQPQGVHSNWIWRLYSIPCVQPSCETIAWQAFLNQFDSFTNKVNSNLIYPSAWAINHGF